jgi:tripartite-type tricarboxylate transporter receptor subunit TctC
VEEPTQIRGEGTVDDELEDEVTRVGASAREDEVTRVATPRHEMPRELVEQIERARAGAGAPQLSPYDPNEDFVAVARVNTAQPVLVVRQDSEFETWEELVEYGRENPGELSFGHSGNWGAFMVPGLALLQEVGVEATLIPYQGGGPVIQALLAGDVDFTFAFPSVLAGQDLRALLIVGEEQIVEGIPTTAELGFDPVSNIGVMHRPVLAPAGTPEDRLEVLREAFRQIDEDQTYQRLMERLGENTAHMDGPEYNEVRRRQSENYKELVDSFTQ